MKKLFAILVAMIILTVSCFAAAEQKHDPVTLEVCIVDTNWQDAWKTMKANFETEYPWITVESVGSDQNITEFISTRIAAQDLPASIMSR